jgi:putative hydrolase of the HAD superfamily
MFDIIAFDADDTLWHNERLYNRAQEKLAGILAVYDINEKVREELYAREVQNIPIYGYGIKSFALSMIELSIEVTKGNLQAKDVAKIIDIAKNMLTAEVDLFEHAESTVRELSKSFDLMMITKGDLLDQESKLKRSGIDKYFRWVEIVSEKTHEVYSSIFSKYRIEPRRFLMVGNSLKSDILPVIQSGGHAVFVPYDLSWAHENLTGQKIEKSAYHELENLGQLPVLVADLSKS